ncbi:hypothetical protein ACTMJF_23985, partial [Escherichia coli]|uniref:hypothetical protein n=1 Tax=Escherichia coli TaxID=562 RepID=UPI003F8AEB81
MITYILGDKLDNYKILIFYLLRELPIEDLRRNIWQKILDYEEDKMNKFNQEWLKELEEIDNERYNN